MTPTLQCVIMIFFLTHWHPAERMKEHKRSLMMLVGFMAPLRSTKWLVIFTSLLASKYTASHSLKLCAL